MEGVNWQISTLSGEKFARTEVHHEAAVHDQVFHFDGFLHSYFVSFGKGFTKIS